MINKHVCAHVCVCGVYTLPVLQRHPDHIHITVAVTRMDKPRGRVHYGVCSAYLASLEAHAEKVFSLPLRSTSYILMGFFFKFLHDHVLILYVPRALFDVCRCPSSYAHRRSAYRGSPLCISARPPYAPSDRLRSPRQRWLCRLRPLL